jgi:transposase
MIVNRIRRALERLKVTTLPQSALGRAIAYALELWDGLVVFLDDGRVEIDNNPVENSIRPSAIGEKNWLFVGEADAGDRAAIVYTVIESCRRRGIDPYAYRKDVLMRLPGMNNQQIPTVTPAAWAEAQDRDQRATAA